MEQLTRWSLNDLLPEPVDQSLEEIFSKLEQALGQFEATRASAHFRNLVAGFPKSSWDP